MNSISEITQMPEATVAVAEPALLPLATTTTQRSRLAEFYELAKPRMNFLVVAQSAASFDAWALRHQQPPSGPDNQLAANGTLQVFLQARGATTYAFVFSGADANGRTWSTTLNVVLRKAGFQTAFLPSTCNWMCNRALPQCSADGMVLLEPNPPFSRIGVIHMTSETKNGQKELMGTDGRLHIRSLRYDGHQSTAAQNTALPYA